MPTTLPASILAMYFYRVPHVVVVAGEGKARQSTGAWDVTWDTRLAAQRRPRERSHLAVTESDCIPSDRRMDDSVVELVGWRESARIGEGGASGKVGVSAPEYLGSIPWDWKP